MLFESMTARRVRCALAVYWPALAIATHWPNLDFPNPDVGWIDADKLVHASVFALLAWLLVYGRFAGRSAGIHRNLIVGLVVAAIYAIVDEFTQGWTARSVSKGDLVADFCGVMAVGVWVGWRHRQSRQHSTEPLGQNDNIIPAQSDVSSAPSDRPRGLVGNTKLVAGLTAISRVLGLARDAVLAACFGLSSLTDAFWIGFVVPNLFRRLFGEGALTAAFIPTYTQLLASDRLLARRLAWLCVAFLFVTLGALTLVGEMVLAVALNSVQWSDDTALAIRLTMIMLPYMPLICVVALLGGLLQVHHRFGPPAAAPVLLNLVMILTAIGTTFGVMGHMDLHEAVTMVAGSVVLAGLLQLIWQGSAALRCEAMATDLIQARGALRSVLVLMIPMALGLAVFQINALFDSLIAWALSPKAGGSTTLHWFGREMDYPIQSGAVTAVQYAQRLYQFPLGVFGIALATAIFPALARAAAAPDDTGGLTAFSQTIRQGLRLTVFVGLPASAGLMLVRIPLVRTIFQRNQFTLEDTLRVATILAGYASAVWAYSMTHVLTRAFYALKDTRTPLRISLIMVCVNLVLNITLVWPLGAAALAWSTALSAMGQACLLLIALRRHIDWPVDRAVRLAWAQAALLTAAMGVLLWPLSSFYPPADLSSLGAVVQLLIMVIAGLATIFCGAKLIGAQELQWLLQHE